MQVRSFIKPSAVGSRYIRLCKSVQDKGRLVKLNGENLDKELASYLAEAPELDWYKSLYEYGEDAFKYFTEHQGSLAGFSGKATSKIMLFDFDSKNLEEAQEDTLNLLLKLDEFGIDVSESCRVYFSGNKGFHVEVYTNKQFEPEELKKTCELIAGEFKTFDSKVYNTTRLIRIKNTKHQKSGKYKIEIDPNFLQTKTAEEIKEYASQPNTTYSPVTPITDLSFIDQIKPKEKPKSVVVSDTSDESDYRGIDRVDYSKMPKGMPRCLYTVSQGVMPTGKGVRSELFLRLATYYRNQGFAKRLCYNLLKGVSALNAEIYPEQEKLSKEELYNTIIKSAYDGTFKVIMGATGTSKDNETLKSFCDGLDQHTQKSCSLHGSMALESKPMQIEDVFDSFKDFAQNFDKNSIKTGIGFIDEHMNLSVGTTTLLVGAAGCHRKGQKVLLHDGSLKKVEDVKIGDKLMGPDSRPRNVLKLCRGVDTMYKITPTKGKPFFVNGNHVLSHINSHGNWLHPTVKELANYKKTGRCLVRTGVEFEKKELKIDPYVLGVWLGDGHSSGPRFTFIDLEIIAPLKNFCDKVGLIFNKEKANSNRAPNYSISGKKGELRHILKDYNLLQNKHIPMEFKTSSREDRLQLLAGLLDTDGHLGSNCFEITQKNKNLAEDIQYLARSLGFAAYVKPCLKKCQTGAEGTYYRMTISGNVEQIPTRIKRKKATKRRQIKSVLKTGFTIEKISDLEEYYGFHLDCDHLYLLDDFTITHNSGKTTMALNIMENANANGLHTMFFSLDMNKNLVYLKLAQKLTNYSQKRILEIYKNKEKDKVEEIRSVISSKYQKTYFDFTTAMTLEQMRDKILETEQRTGNKIKLVVVDYASRIVSDKADAYANARHNAIKSTEMANVTDSAWIFISQISRNSGDGSTPIRTKRAAKDSGDWEESATNVITCWRPFMGDVENDDAMRIFLAKNRMGKELEEVLYWNGAKGIVRDMSTDEKVMYDETRGIEAEKEFQKSKYMSKS